MARSLDPVDPPVPSPQALSGIRIERYETARDEEVRLAHNSAFAAHFGSTERDPQEWRGYFTGPRSFRPELSPLAVTDDGSAAIVGYLLSYVYEADVAAFLGVDAANATGALGLYDRAGYRVQKRSTSWGRQVPART